MGEGLSSGHNRDFWKEIQAIKKTKRSTPSAVDNANTKQDFAHLFYLKFKDLYNAKQVNKEGIDDIMTELDIRINACSRQTNTIDYKKIFKNRKIRLIAGKCN